MKNSILQLTVIRLIIHGISCQNESVVLGVDYSCSQFYKDRGLAKCRSNKMVNAMNTVILK